MRHRFLFPCLVVSGTAGLAYELLWTRLLSFSFGSTMLSFSTVLAVFFGGLALGAYAGGRRSVSLERPVRAYGFIEIVIGAFGLLLYPVLDRLDDLFAALDPGSGLSGAIARFAVAAPLLAVPTVLMGATLPIVSRAMIVRNEDVGRGSALIYGLNTFGAFLGAYITTFHLLPAFGLFRSILFVAMANSVVGAIALAGDLRAKRPQLDGAEAHTKEDASNTSALGVASPPPTPEPGAGAARDPRAEIPHKVVAVSTALTFLGGFAAISFQVVWVRVFSTFLDGTIYGVGTVLISVLVGIALGSMFIARVSHTSRHLGLWFTLLQLATIASVLLISRNLFWIGYELQALAGARGRGIDALHAQLLLSFVVLSVPTFCSGASLPLLVRITENRASNTGRALGQIYAANTVGSILGALAAGFLLIPRSGSEATTLIAIALTAGSGAVGAVILIPERSPFVRIVLAIVALASVSAYEGLDLQRVLVKARPRVSFVEHREAADREVTKLAYFAEGPSATVSVFASEEVRSLSLNGLGQGSRRLPPPHHALESLLVALVPMIHTSQAKRAMVIGLGAGVTIDAMQKLGVAAIDVVELEPKVADAVKVVFGTENPLESKGVRLAIDDARHHLLLNGRRGDVKYDLITSMPAHPWVAASIFTEEFFELARRSLSESGVFCTWFGLTKMDDQATKSLFRAFTRAFRHYVIYWIPEVGAYYLVGSISTAPPNLDRLRKLQDHPIVRQHPALRNPYFFPARVYASGDDGTPSPQGGVVNTDDSAFVEVHAPRSSTVSPILSGFMPREYLMPSLIEEGARHSFFLELMEQLLGTPRGEIPWTAYGIDAARARRTFRAFSGWSPDESAYLLGRLALAEGHTEPARSHLLRAAASDTPIASRAAKFAALAHPLGSSQMLEALLAVEPETDVVIKLLEIDVERAKARIPESGASPDLDPLGWFLRRTRLGKGALSTADRELFEARVGPELATAQNIGLLGLCEEFAARHGFEREGRACGEWRARQQSRTAAELTRRGTRAGARGDFASAAKLLSKANALAPGSLRTMSLLLRSLVEIGDRHGIDDLLSELRFQGHSDELAAHLLRQAETGALGGDLLGLARSSTAPGGTIGSGGASEGGRPGGEPPAPRHAEDAPLEEEHEVAGPGPPP